MASQKIPADFCLLIPCYNNFSGLIISLKTVDYQPNPFVVLVVDDGSDSAIEEQLIRDEIGADFPVTVIRNAVNQGITRSLNNGLEWIDQHLDTSLVARLDCGDLCSNERFYVQVKFMQDHPRVGLLGSWCRFVDEETSLEYVYKTVTEHEQIKRAMYSRNVFMHATVMFRLSLAKNVGNYPYDFEYAEDYAFFWRMMEAGDTAIEDKILVTCRVNRGGLSFKNRGKQLAARWKVIKRFSNNRILSAMAFIRLKVLFILPKELLLRLKKMRG